jgi:hypothetical protein
MKCPECGAEIRKIPQEAKMGLRELNKLLKKRGAPECEEVSRKGKTFYRLHICKNGNPCPLFYTEDSQEMKNYIENEDFE